MCDMATLLSTSVAVGSIRLDEVTSLAERLDYWASQVSNGDNLLARDLEAASTELKALRTALLLVMAGKANDPAAMRVKQLEDALRQIASRPAHYDYAELARRALEGEK
jgi:hypothetical protein